MFDWLLGDEKNERNEGGCSHRNVERSGDVEVCSSCGMRWDFKDYGRNRRVGITDPKKDEYDAW